MIDKRKFYINGQWVSPSKPNDYEVINPSTEEAFATISLGSTEDTNAAVSAAKKALVSWSESSKDERLNLLEKLLSIYKKEKHQVYTMIATDGAKGGAFKGEKLARERVNEAINGLEKLSFTSIFTSFFYDLRYRFKK